MAEIQARLTEMIERARLLGATDEQIADLREQWEGSDAEGQEVIFRQNDQMLGSKLAREQREAAGDAIANDEHPKTAQAISDYREMAMSQEDEDWGTLGLAVPTILEVLGDDAEHAYRLYKLEETADHPRVTLIAALEAIAWPNGKPEDEDPDALPVLSEGE